jgi:hypothetical protein
MLQEAFAANDTPQVLVWVKPALGVMLNAIAVPPELVTVNALAALGDPTATLPNEIEAGLMVTGTTPVPVMAADRGLPNPL